MKNTRITAFLPTFFSRLILAVVAIVWFVSSFNSVSAAVDTTTKNLLIPLDGLKVVLEQSGRYPQALAFSAYEGFEYRLFIEDSWTSWEQALAEEPGLKGSALKYVEKPSSLEIRLNSNQQPLELDLHLFYFSSDKAPQYASLQPILQSFVISREQWGADESIGTFVPDEEEVSDESGRDKANVCDPLVNAFPEQYQTDSRTVYFNKLGKNLVWPRRYSQQVKKMVIHHSALDIKDFNEDGLMDKRDYQMAVQSIYAYHTVSRKWGDIGYHFLVDPDGNVYEGRAGGESVIAGHALCQNANTIGIVMLGNFEENKPTRDGLRGLIRLVAVLSRVYSINPLGKSQFRGTIIPHITTHAELGNITKNFIGRGATVCPGNHMKALMPLLRSQVASYQQTLIAQETASQEYRYELVKQAKRPVIGPLTQELIAVDIKNTGKTTWTNVSVTPRGKFNQVLSISDVSVQPQENIRLEIPVKTSFSDGNQSSSFFVSADDKRMAGTLTVDYRVRTPSFRYGLVGFDSGEKSGLIGDQKTVNIRLRNLSNFAWDSTSSNAIVMRQIIQKGRRTEIKNTPFSFTIPGQVEPGEEVSFNMPLKLPSTPGSYTVSLAPALQGKILLDGDLIRVASRAELPRFSARLEAKDSGVLRRGNINSKILRIRNTGNFSWQPHQMFYQLEDLEPVLIPVEVPVNHFIEINWVTAVPYKSRSWQVTARVGTTNRTQGLVAELLGRVQKSLKTSFRATGAVQFRGEIQDNQLRWLGPEGGRYYASFDIKNTGTVPWYREGNNAIFLRANQPSLFKDERWQGENAGWLEQAVVSPGEIGRFVVPLTTLPDQRRTIETTFKLYVKGFRTSLNTTPILRQYGVGDFRRLDRRGKIPEESLRVNDYTPQFIDNLWSQFSQSGLLILDESDFQLPFDLESNAPEETNLQKELLETPSADNFSSQSFMEIDDEESRQVSLGLDNTLNTSQDVSVPAETSQYLSQPSNIPSKSPGRNLVKPQVQAINPLDFFRSSSSGRGTTLNNFTPRENSEINEDISSQGVPPLRVWLSGFSDEKATVKVSSAFSLHYSSGIKTQYSAGDVVTLSPLDFQSESLIRVVPSVSSGIVQITSWDRTQQFGSKIFYDNQFRGIIELRVSDDKRALVAINELALEDYLKGVAEVPESADQPQEKRKVLAVLARSYALHYMVSGYKKFPHKPYTAADSPQIFQKYLGYGFEQRAPKWLDAVDSTRSQVVMVSPSFDTIAGPSERVLRTAYFSCTNGERTLSPEEAGWDTGAGYFNKYSEIFSSRLDPFGDDPNRQGVQQCGHQVGLSAYGAKKLAEQGLDYKDIIEYYYNNILVEKYPGL